MNISTYEARIKALEDQLNPPTPSVETGVASLTVTPNVPLLTGYLNAELARLMPLQTLGEHEYEFSSRDELEEGSTYSVTLTPGTSWEAMIYGYGGQSEIGAVGQPVTASLIVTHGELRIGVSAGANLQDEEDPNQLSAEIVVKYVK